ARPGGVVVVEDVDFSGHFCWPPSGAFERYVQLYQSVVRGRGADPDIGPRLPSLLEAAGVDHARLDVVLPAFREGEGKAIARATLDGIRESALAAGLATASELDAIAGELAALEQDRGVILSLPRIFQVWGRTGGGTGHVQIHDNMKNIS